MPRPTRQAQLRFVRQRLAAACHRRHTLEQQGGIKMVHVPPKGTGPRCRICWVARGYLTFGTAPPFMPHIASGKLRVAVTGKERLPSLPDAPTTAEAGYPA